MPSTGKRSRARAERDHRSDRRGPHPQRHARAGARSRRAAAPWDIEFGFVDGKLWLFQCRPFVGNDALKNIPALATLEGRAANGTDMLSLEEKSPMRWRAIAAPRGRRAVAAPARAALDATETEWDGSRPPPASTSAGTSRPSTPASRRARRTPTSAPHRALARQPGARDGRPRRHGARRLRDDSSSAAKVYQELIDRGVISPHDQQAVRALHRSARRDRRRRRAASHDRAKTVELMSTLNPERVFRIRVPLDEIAKRWQPKSSPASTPAHRRRRSSTPPTRLLPAAST